MRLGFGQQTKLFWWDWVLENIICPTLEISVNFVGARKRQNPSAKQLLDFKSAKHWPFGQIGFKATHLQCKRQEEEQSHVVSFISKKIIWRGPR